MKKLIYAGVAATLTLMTASPAFAQDVESDLTTAVQNRIAISQDLADVAERTAGATVVATDEAVLGEQALPIMGIEAPVSVKLDMLTALRADAAKNRALSLLPFGGSTD